MTTETAPSPATEAPAAGSVRQKLEFRSGNEAAALAARDVGFHVMGYFPITPSTEVAENLSKMQANGEHEIVMVAGDVSSPTSSRCARRCSSRTTPPPRICSSASDRERCCGWPATPA